MAAGVLAFFEAFAILAVMKLAVEPTRLAGVEIPRNLSSLAASFLSSLRDLRAWYCGSDAGDKSVGAQALIEHLSLHFMIGISTASLPMYRNSCKRTEFVFAASSLASMM